MKKSRFCIVLLILQLGIINEIIAKECTVAGLSKDKSTDVILKNYYSSHTAKPNSSGLFSFRISITSPQYFQLKTDKTIHLFLIPGDSIFVNLDNKATVNPDNESALISNYLINWYAYTDSLATNFDRVAFYSKDPASFNTAVMDLYEAILAPFNKFLASYPDVNKEFVRLEKERLKFWAWCPYNRYEYRYQLYTGNKVQLPANFYEYLHKADFNDPSFLQFSDFDDYTRTYLEMKVFKASQQDPKSYVDPYFTMKVLLKAIKETFTNQKVLDEILYKQTWGQIYYMDINDSLFAIVEKTIRNPKYVKGLRKLYRSLERFQTGHSAPDFTVMDVNDRTYALKDFRGKYLLIDVWGVYCGPCIKELPALKDIEAEFRDANITFVQVNLDGTKDTWIKRIKELDLHGLQFMAKNGWESEFQKAYEIDQVPTFILIDREGRFVDARTKLPSEGLRYVLSSLPAIRNK
jgi:thiol-disulfide isomerase/thioredoxin